MTIQTISFDNLSTSDLFVDCIYKGGTEPNLRAEVLSHLLPKCGNSGGFRIVNSLVRTNSKRIAYVVLYTSTEEIDWPDYLNKENGLFQYFGDNRESGREMSSRRGNQLLEEVFANLREEKYSEIPPFLIFKKSKYGRDVQFLGLAVPGNPEIGVDEELTAFWRMSAADGGRFQNYRAYFTVLDAPIITRKWLLDRLNKEDDVDENAPDAWLSFTKYGKSGIYALKPELDSKDKLKPPSKEDQLEQTMVGRESLRIIRKYYESRPHDFEFCAVDIVSKLDRNFRKFVLTRRTRDGGRDAVASYEVRQNNSPNLSVTMECSIEAKCYAPGHGVGVKEMSRLISRLRYRQFGIMVTTSYISDQVYKEIIQDQHPILIITARDIEEILCKNGIFPKNIKDWLLSLENKYERLGVTHFE